MTRLLITFIGTCLVASTLLGFGEDSDTGTWPKSWPQELEPLRKQSRSMTGGRVMLSRHEIRFTDCEQFEAAWPHLLKVKAIGAPIVLFRGSSQKYKCHVRVQCPSAYEKSESPARPIPSAKDTRTRWIKTTYLELYVDGEIVDLNRIRFPADTPIVDERFKDGITKSSIKDILATKITVERDNDSLELGVLARAAKVKADHPAFRIKIIGNDLKFAGITKNQRIRGLKLKDKTVAEVLTALVLKANPASLVNGPSDPRLKLVWVIAADPDEPEVQSVLITTRGGAKKQGDKLPQMFRAEKPDE